MRKTARYNSSLARCGWTNPVEAHLRATRSTAHDARAALVLCPQRFTFLQVIVPLTFLVCLLSIFTPSASAQTTRPAEHADQVTQDLLSELQRTSVSQPSTTAPSATSSEPFGDAADIPWGRLIDDFKFMLVTASAVGVAGAVLGLFVLLRAGRP